jgi:hypothetical protein
MKKMFLIKLYRKYNYWLMNNQGWGWFLFIVVFYAVAIFVVPLFLIYIVLPIWEFFGII